MQVEARKPDPARAQTRVATVSAHAMVALLLLLLMPLGLLHRSSSDVCRYDHGAVSDGRVAASSDVGHDVASAALAGQVNAVGMSAVAESAGVVDEHGGHAPDLPPYGASSSACGTAAALTEGPMSAGAPRAGTALPIWRALSPLVLAAPPPAPPPRLS